MVVKQLLTSHFITKILEKYFITTINWQQPRFTLLWVGIFYGAAIFIYFTLPFELNLLSLLIWWALLGLALFLFYKKLKIILFPVVIFSLGFLCAYLHSHWQGQSFQHYLSTKSLQIEGIVHQANDGLRYSNVVIKNSEGRFWRLRLQEKQAPLPGTVITLWAKPLSNQQEFFQYYRFFNNIHGYAIALSSYDIVRYAEGNLAVKIARLRLNIARMLESKTYPQYAGVARALLVGMKGTIEKDVLEAMRHAGLGHILAISGLHFGIFAFGVFALVRFILAGFPTIAERYHIKKIAAFVAIFSGFCYLLLSGGAISAERAFIMVGFVCLAVMRDMRAFSQNLLAVAFIILLSLKPYIILQVGFQMSFMAVLALIALFDYLRDSAYYRLPKILRFIFGMALTSIVASIAVAPFTLLYFHYFSNYGLVANLPVLPMMAFWVMPWAVLTLLLMPFQLHDIPMQLMYAGIHKMGVIAKYVAALPGSVSHITPPSALAIICLFLGVLIISIAWRHRICVIVACGSLLAGLLFVMMTPQPALILTGWNYGFSHQQNNETHYIFSQNLPRGNKRKEILTHLGDAPIDYLKKSNIADNNNYCDTILCVINSQGLKILLAHKAEGVLVMCRQQAHVFISLYDVPQLCNDRKNKNSLMIFPSQFRQSRQFPQGSPGLFIFKGLFGSPFIRYFYGQKPLQHNTIPLLSLFFNHRRVWHHPL